MKILGTRSKNIATMTQGHQVIQENKIRPFSWCLACPNDCLPDHALRAGRSVGRGDLVASRCSSFEAPDKFGNWNFSQRWERGKVSLLLLTFSHPSVSERCHWSTVVQECHEEHEDTKDDLHGSSYLIFLDMNSCLSALVARTRRTLRQVVRTRTMMKGIHR